VNSYSANNVVIRFNPAEFWSATRLMTQTERDLLLDAITKLAEAQDVQGLSHFKFVTFGVKPAMSAA
jgi:hypothetical protein